MVLGRWAGRGHKAYGTHNLGLQSGSCGLVRTCAGQREPWSDRLYASGKRTCLAKQLSITYTMPSSVTEVSAMLVAAMTCRQGDRAVGRHAIQAAHAFSHPRHPQTTTC